MFFSPPLVTATFVKRYKRFLVDVELTDGTILTIHCPNTGSMRSCSTPGSLAAFSESNNPKRKYPHTLEMIQDNSTWVGVNTSRTNSLVAEAITTGRIEEFKEVDSLRQEVKVSAKSRLDLALYQGQKTTYIEIKNCSLVENECAMFPDAVTERGKKHLNELIVLASEGFGACIFFLVQRADATRFAPAREIDPQYATTLKEASRKGVLILAYRAEVSPEGIEVVQKLPIEL